MSIWLWILVAVGVLVGLLLLLGLFAMWREARDLKALNRAIEEGNTDAIVSALRKWSDTIVMRAAEELVRSGDTIHIPALLDAYFNPVSKKSLRERLAQEIFKLPREQVACLLRERLDSDQKFLATELLLKLDDPTARAEMEHLARSEELGLQQREIIRTILKAPEIVRTKVVVAVPPEIVEEFAEGRVAGKIIGGMLSGGIMAVTEDRVTINGFVTLPEACALCGYLAGEHDRWADCSYQIGSHGWKLMGVNTSGKAVLDYKVCSKCGELDEQAGAIKISLEADEQKNWLACLSLLNSRIAEQINELNGVSEVVTPPRT